MKKLWIEIQYLKHGYITNKWVSKDLSPKSIVFTVILYYFCSGKVCEVFQHKDKVQHQRTQWEEQGEKDKYVMCREI